MFVIWRCPYYRGASTEERFDCTSSSPPGGGRVLNKVLYGEAPPRGPNPYPFMYHF